MASKKGEWEMIAKCKCGNTPAVYEDGGYYFVLCPFCGERTTICWWIDDAIREWESMLKENWKMNRQFIDILNYADSTLSGGEHDHVRNVALNVEDKWRDNRCRCVAYLHDMVEDGYATFEELRERFNLDPEQMAALDAITRRKGEQYFDYIQRVKQNEMAKTVKLADLQHNISRCADDLPNRWGLVRRYGKAYGMLIGEWKEQVK